MHRPHTDFALGLHHRLPETGNLAWSPYSVASALGVAAAGARGQTHDQLARVLAPGGDVTELGRMLAGSAQPADADAAVANTLWMRQGWHFQADYQQSVRQWPGGAVKSADFAGDPEGAREAINEDVAGTTRGLIRELLAPGMIHPDVAAVIVNALYLKVAWLNPFAEEGTTPSAFHTPAGPREVPTMRQQETLRYATAAGWQMVTLPTAGDVAVDVLLPGAGRLTGDTLAALHEAAHATKVDLMLPRFRIETAAILTDLLRRLGIVAAFERAAADFSGITDADRIWIEQVVHKAVLRVDEQGFEGAAATALVMRTVSMDVSRPVPFHVDRPFLVLVRHRGTGAIYFLARVAEPGQG